MSSPGESSRRCRVDVEVRYAETDQMGVVHHSVYLVWFELARTRLCLETGYHYSEIEDLGYFLVVTRTEARLLRGATYGETVGVTCWRSRSSTGSITSRYRSTTRPTFGCSSCRKSRARGRRRSPISSAR